MNADLLSQILFLGIVNSILMNGIMVTVKKYVPKLDDGSRLSTSINLVIVYVGAFLLSFTLKSETVYEKIVYGLCVGSVAITVYKTVVQAMLDSVPNFISGVFNLISNLTTKK